MKATANSMRASRRLRREMSLPEVILWQLLRRSPGGVRFRHQYAVGPYVADFYCPSAKLVIEIEGAVHDMGNRPEQDNERSVYLKSLGLEVTRMPAKDVLKDARSVADALVRLCG